MPLMIEGQQPIQQFAAGGFGDGETNALLGVVEAVIQGEVLPAIRGSHGAIHFNVQSLSRTNCPARKKK
jgi:hypothetical protein